MFYYHAWASYPTFSVTRIGEIYHIFSSKTSNHSPWKQSTDFCNYILSPKIHISDSDKFICLLFAQFCKNIESNWKAISAKNAQLVVAGKKSYDTKSNLKLPINDQKLKMIKKNKHKKVKEPQIGLH